jgi:outer membrane protein OmpA-like peptidoglycan-associated protein
MEKRVTNDRNSFTLRIAIFFTAALFIISSLQLQAQTTKKVNQLFKDAQAEFSKANYNRTIDLCNQMLVINANLVGVQMLMANVYVKKKQPNLELQHLYKAIKLHNHPYIKWRLAEVHLKMGNYSEALYYYNIYSRYKYISEKRRMELACKRASCIFNIQGIKKNIDTSNSQSATPVETFWPTLAPDGKKLIFLQEGENKSRQNGNFISGVDTLNSGFFEPIEDSLFTKNNVQSISEHKKIIFFTGYNRNDGFGDADIYFSRFQNGAWSEPVNAGEVLNSTDSESQPFFTTDNKYLYFTSNRAAGVGGNDIWRARLKELPEIGIPVWETPENMGAINTAGNEISPFYYSKNRQLYFASDTQLGLGGYDIFAAPVDGTGSISAFENIGAPINTNADELGVVISPISDTAFFSLARNKDTGLEIFSFNYVRGLKAEPLFYIWFNVFDKNTTLPVQAEIEIVDESNSPVKSKFSKTDKSGKLMQDVKPNRNYMVNISCKNYMFSSKTVMVNKANSPTKPLVLNIGLIPIEVGSVVDLYNIFFETNSYAILPGSKSELNRVVKFLKNNNKLKVEIQGHTDSTGNTGINMKLSKDRAKSVVDYLVGKGINSAQLDYKGYGDTKPIASNETEEGRKLNRRTTIKIIEK